MTRPGRRPSGPPYLHSVYKIELQKSSGFWNNHRFIATVLSTLMTLPTLKALKMAGECGPYNFGPYETELSQ